MVSGEKYLIEVVPSADGTWCFAAWTAAGSYLASGADYADAESAKLAAQALCDQHARTTAATERYTYTPDVS